MSQNNFQLTQTLDIRQPQSTEAMVIPKGEWETLKSSVGKIEDNNSMFHTVGSAFVGAGVSVGAAAIFTTFTPEQAIDEVIMWAVAACFTFCGVASCVFASKEKSLVKQSSANVISQMDLIEKRYPDA
ncbi:TPA: hypothetical protein NKQ44_004443 [Vibrio parahaemolyticus]|nr:hypothetical protein [Vibrio parahaemolyticus]HCH1613844.1 hypothetical protein [Vibrio parahaemolyticus]